MANRMKKTTIATLASSLSEANRTLVPLTKKLASIAALISETEKALGGYQEIADGVIVVRKSRATRGKAKKKAGRPAGKKKGSGLSSQLKAFRKKAGLNQEALAKKLGVNVASVRAWEQGRSNPRAKALKKIERILGGKAGKPKKTRKASKPRKVVKVAPSAGPEAPAA